MRCEHVHPDDYKRVEAGLVIATPPVLLIAYALRAHRSGRLDAITADGLIRRLMVSGDATAEIVAGFLLARQHRRLDMSPPAAGVDSMTRNPQPLNSSTEGRSS